ncbi:MAG: TIGR03663 family protein [Ktedonobacteraceae bacterium]|nr:TIGR03663 family protein [Ktedonobacteraceae bacterium]
MKSYDTEPRDNMAVQSSLEEGSEVKQSQASAENIEKASEVAEPEVSVSDVVDRETEVDERHSNPMPPDEHAAVEDDADAKNEQPDTHTLIHPGGVSDGDEDDEDSEGEQPQRRIFSPPTRSQLLEWLPFWGIILLAAILRFWGLGDKPLHHDESLHAYYAWQLMINDLQNWASCFNGVNAGCYRYDPLLHGPFQFHAIAFVYQISQWLHAPDNGVNTTTVRIAAATLGTVIVGLPYFLRDYLGRIGALLASFLLAVSPSMVYFSRFAREDIYLVCFTFLMVVAVARYVRDRKMSWLVLSAAAFSLAYATAEATFLTIAIFGSFLGALIAWELGKRWPLRARVSPDVAFRNYLPETGGSVAVALYFLIFLPIAKIGLSILSNLSVYITDPKNVATSDLFVQNLKNNTVMVVPWIGIILGVYVLSILVREMLGKIPPPGRRGLAKRVDPEQQPLLDSIVTMPWTHWFFALLCAWAIFLLLFTALFTNIRSGIGDGIWQGLYYWLQQQVARGGQPWYYYLLLIPLYEQVGLVFGLVGVVRSLLRPTRFRLFLVYWFVGNFFIFSWAAEKMPWLMILIAMPMLLLAAIGLEPAVVKVVQLVKERLPRRETASPHGQETPELASRSLPKMGLRSSGGVIITCVLAVMLLVLTLQNMYQVTYVHYADGPREMMIYVQTTTDVNTVMTKIDELDLKVNGGHHQLTIGVMKNAGWPFYWYLRNYPNACFNFPTYCSVKNPSIIIGAQDDSFLSSYMTQYLTRQYKLRSWWDEGYKPAPCVPSKTVTCDSSQTWGGVGPGLWLSYGDNPPPGAGFNLGLAVKNIWNWWWYRKPIGSTDGAYYITVFVQKGLGVEP